MKRMLLLFVTTVVFVGCGNGDKLEPSIENLGRATGPGGGGQMAAAAPEMARRPMGKVHKGKIVETMNASTYTYVRIETTAGAEVWAAIPSDKVEVGQSISITESVVMKDFESRTLNRKFETIIFGVREDAAGSMGAMQKAGQPSGTLPAGHPQVPGAGSMPKMRDMPKEAMGKPPGQLPPGHPPVGGANSPEPKAPPKAVPADATAPKPSAASAE